jgi:hypothetical protein
VQQINMRVHRFSEFLSTLRRANLTSTWIRNYSDAKTPTSIDASSQRKNERLAIYLKRVNSLLCFEKRQ